MGRKLLDFWFSFLVGTLGYYPYGVVPSCRPIAFRNDLRGLPNEVRKLTFLLKLLCSIGITARISKGSAEFFLPKVGKLANKIYFGSDGGSAHDQSFY